MSAIILSSSIPRVCTHLIDSLTEALGIRDVSDEVISTAAEEFSVPMDDLKKAVDVPPSLFGMSLKKQCNCVAYIQSALATRFLEDNVLYCGKIGHFLIQGVAHIVSVGVVEPIENQIDDLARQEGVERGEAQKLVKRSQKIYDRLVKDVLGEDGVDLSKYDLVINLNKIEEEEAIDLIRRTVESPRFKTTTYSMQLLRDFELAYRVRGHLVDIDSDVRVQADDGNVDVVSRAAGKAVKSRTGKIRKRVEKLQGVKNVEIRVREDSLKRYSGKGL